MYLHSRGLFFVVSLGLCCIFGAMADNEPIITPIVWELAFNSFVGSLVSYSPSTTIIVLGCVPEQEGSGLICDYSPTITFGPSTYVISITDNVYSQGPTIARCGASNYTPTSCIESQRQSDFEPITHIETDAAYAAVAVPVTITAGAELMGDATSTFATPLSFGDDPTATDSLGRISSPGVAPATATVTSGSEVSMTGPLATVTVIPTSPGDGTLSLVTVTMSPTSSGDGAASLLRGSSTLLGAALALITIVT